MTLGELIEHLEQYAPETKVNYGFGAPHAQRDHHIAFPPRVDTTVGSMLLYAREAISRRGKFEINADSKVYLACYKEPGEEIGSSLLHYMLRDTDRSERKELAKILGADTNASWSTIIGHARRVKEQADKKIVVQEILGTLGKMELWSTVMQGIELQLSDEAVYQHLMTCVSVLDDEDQKRMLRDAAELFADEFCSTNRVCVKEPEGE